MDDSKQPDLDDSTEEAWSRFRLRLADWVAAMEDDEVLLVEAEHLVDEDEPWAAPYVQFCGWGDTLVRCEVSSNEFLAESVRLDVAGAERVVELGWVSPTASREDEPGEGSANYFLDTERVEADRLAAMTTRVLREVFGVLHPSFLSADGLEHDLPESVDDGDTVEQPDEPLATRPRDRDHLVRLVDDTLTPLLGRSPEHDEDDDICIEAGSNQLYVRVLHDLPIVKVFGRIAQDVSDHAKADFELNVLNRDEPLLSFTRRRDDVVVSVDLPALPFVPQHLRDMLEILAKRVPLYDEDLVARVGGRRPAEVDPDPPAALCGPYSSQDAVDSGVADDDASIHPATMTLLQLDAASPGSVTPELAASICSGDPDLVLELITWNSEQEISWTEARDSAASAGDFEEAEVCSAESAQAAATAALLREALRFLAEQRLGRERASRSYRRRRHPIDSALPGMDAREDEPRLFDPE